MHRLFVTLIIAAVAISAFVSPGMAGKQVSTSFNMPAVVHAKVDMTGCSNSPGPYVTFSGDMAISGLGVNLIFKNNEKGTHEHEDGTVVSSSLVTAGHTIVLPKQPSRGGVGGNPFCWIQFISPTGAALSQEIFMGRCVQGQLETTAPVGLAVVATADVSATDCSNNPGPYITLDGAMVFSQGLNCKMIFRNNDNPVGGPHKAEDEHAIEVKLIAAGTAIQFPKQPVLGGVGGNPWISLQFNDGNGTALGKETLLGRCVQMSK